MANMKAVQVTKAGAPFDLVERPVPEVKAGHVRIKVEACGICHSDALVHNAAWPGITLPRVPGHEIAGRVDAVGAGVTAWKAGDRAGVGWYGGHCGQCAVCRRGDFLLCATGKITGITHDGGYAEYALVPAESVARIPEKLSAVDAAPLLCAGVTTFNALRHSGARAGDTVAVQGIGGLGHLGVQYAARMGFRTVALSRGKDKADYARQLGAHEYIDTAQVPVAEGLARLGGADVILATAPSAEALTAAIGGLKPRGLLLIVAAAHEAFSISAVALLSGRRIAGWPSGVAIDSEETMAFSQMAGVKPRTETFRLEQAEQAYAKMMENKVRFRAVLTP
jgi:D-arabinose 1-dehydrogenase-like Zn-dependent alcohol dehydrogenase